MAFGVCWNAVIVEEFKHDALLTEEETAILDALIADETHVAMALKCNVSQSTIDRKIRTLKKKYDVAAMYNPLLPCRHSMTI